MKPFVLLSFSSGHPQQRSNRTEIPSHTGELRAEDSIKASGEAGLNRIDKFVGRALIGEGRYVNPGGEISGCLEPIRAAEFAGDKQINGVRRREKSGTENWRSYFGTENAAVPRDDESPVAESDRGQWQ